MIAVYGTFADHLPSVLLLLAIAVVLYAYSTTGQSASRNNRRPHTPANRGALRRVVGHAPARSGAPSTPAQTPGSRRTPRRPETRSTR